MPAPTGIGPLGDAVGLAGSRQEGPAGRDRLRRVVRAHVARDEQPDRLVAHELVDDPVRPGDGARGEPVEGCQQLR